MLCRGRSPFKFGTSLSTEYLQPRQPYTSWRTLTLIDVMAPDGSDEVTSVQATSFSENAKTQPSSTPQGNMSRKQPRAQRRVPEFCYVETIEVEGIEFLP